MGGAAVAVTAPLFLCGPLARPAVLARVLGPERADLAPAACLPGHRLSVDAPGPRLPGIAPSAQGEVAGRLLRDGAAAERLAAVAQALGAALGPAVTVQAEGGAQLARPLAGASGAIPWQAARWSARSEAIVLEALCEITADLDAGRAGGLGGRRAMILARAWARVAARTSVPAELRSATPAESVARIAVETPHTGFFRTRVYTLRHPRFDGAESDDLRREVFVATDAALVLPYDVARDRVLLVEQFRMGPYGRGDPRPWLLEPVAGRIDAGETPEAAARRECLEEAGLALHGLEKISTHYCTPGYSTEVFHLFLGLCDLADMAPGRGGLDSEHEDIRTHVIGFDRAMALVESGEANNGPLILGLLWLQRERARLRGSG